MTIADRLVTLFVALTATVALAPETAGAQPLAPVVTAVPPTPVHPWEVAVGVRSSAFSGPGYDAFSDGGGFQQIGLVAMRSFAAGPRFRPAVGLIYEGGSNDARARAAASHLSLSRVAIAVEGRYLVGSSFYAFARAAPGLLRGQASLDDSSSPVPLATDLAAFSLDGSGGLALRLASLGTRAAVWAVAEGGYGWATRQTLDLEPQLAPADRPKAGTTSLGTLAERGPYLRLQLALAAF